MTNTEQEYPDSWKDNERFQQREERLAQLNEAKLIDYVVDKVNAEFRPRIYEEITQSDFVKAQPRSVAEYSFLEYQEKVYLPEQIAKCDFGSNKHYNLARELAETKKLRAKYENADK